MGLPPLCLFHVVHKNQTASTCNLASHICMVQTKVINGGIWPVACKPLSPPLSMPGSLSVPPEASCTCIWTCQIVCPSSMQHSLILNNWPWVTKQARGVYSCGVVHPWEEEACTNTLE